MGKYVSMKGKTKIQTKAFDGVFAWSPRAEPDWDGRFALAQKVVDAAVLKHSAPYIPFETGMLFKSGYQSTKIGSGEVVWQGPYAHYLYYGTLYVSPTTGSSWAKKGEKKVPTDRDLKYHGGGKRGKLWFERMKADHRQDILKEAREAMGK
ncbi:MAG: minor capsid protein [Anaerotignum sp.]